MFRIVLALLVLITGAANAQPLPAEIYDADKPYGGHPRHLIDVAARPTANLKPAILIVHGGSWQAGDKRSAARKSKILLNEGFAVASMNYRLHPEATPSDQAEDVAAAAVWLAKNADRYGIDPRQIYLAGHGAGGHLAALVGTDPQYLKTHGAAPSDLGGVLLLDGEVYDVGGEIAATTTETKEGRTLRQVFGPDERVWPDLSPAYQLSEADELPPFFVAYPAGRDDAFRQARPFVRGLRQAGALAVPFEASGRDEETLYRFFGTKGDAMTEALIDFVRQQANIPVARGADGRRKPGEETPWLLAFEAPQEDVNGMRLAGTSISSIVTHEDSLFAGNGFPLASDEIRRGQILRLDAPEERWQLEHQMPRGYTAASALGTASFRTDQEGRPVEPLDYLVAGARFEPFRDGPVPAGLFIRTPSGNWTKQDLGEALGGAVTQTEVTALGSYRDSETGVDRLFAGASPAPHGIYSAAYDPAAPGGLRFGERPEFRPRDGETITGFARCGGAFYAATSRQLLRRRDGANAGWTVIADLQGMVALRPYLQDLDIFWQRQWEIGSFRCDLSANKPTLAFTALGRAFSFSPGDQNPALEEDLGGLIRRQLGREPHFVMAGESTLVRHRGQDVEEWIGLEVYYDPDYIAARPEFPHWQNGFGKDGLYLIRTVIGGQVRYRIEEVQVPGVNPFARPFGRVADFEPSPFDRDNAIYSGGFRPWFDETTDTAWIARGEL